MIGGLDSWLKRGKKESTDTQVAQASSLPKTKSVNVSDKRVEDVDGDVINKTECSAGSPLQSRGRKRLKRSGLFDSEDENETPADGAKGVSTTEARVPETMTKQESCTAEDDILQAPMNTLFTTVAHQEIEEKPRRRKIARSNALGSEEKTHVHGNPPLPDNVMGRVGDSVQMVAESTSTKSPASPPKESFCDPLLPSQDAILPVPVSLPQVSQGFSDSLASDGFPALPLMNTKIVLTGLFKTCSREEMEDHIKRNGGQCTSAVSGRTDILVTGYILETNKPVEEGSKYKKAQQLLSSQKSSRLRIMTEDAFLSVYPMNGTRHEAFNTPVSPTSKATPSISGSAATPGGFSGVDSFRTPTTLTTPAVGSTQLLTARSTTPKTPASPLPGKIEGVLWTEKWRPRRIADILGNGETVRKLCSWLRDWHDVCILGHLKPSSGKTRGGRFAEPERPNARACMLSGPPGVGKTTAAQVVAAECGFNIVEYNSSDDRGKGIVEVIQDMTTGGQTLDTFFSKKAVAEEGAKPVRSTVDEKKEVVLIMDEMDGLSSGDRGGAQALLKLIETTQCPVICICNDRTHPKVRTLGSKCYDLRFSKPQKNTIAKRVCDIAKQEHLLLEYNAAELLCERVGNDLRQILNTLQLLAQGAARKSGVTYDVMRRELGYGLKDNQVMVNPFDMTRRLLTKSEASRMSFNDKLDGYFLDYDIMPLYMEENYLISSNAKFGGYHHGTSYYSGTQAAHGSQSAQYTSSEDFERLTNVADCFTFADILNKHVRSRGQWSLLSDVGLFSVIVPSCQAAAFLARAEFPKWLGKNSTTTKNRRYLNELSLSLSLATTIGPSALRTSGYLELLYAKILEPIMDPFKTDVKESAAKTVQLLDTCGITRDHLIENMTSLRLKRQEALYDMVDSATKRALTTLYNSTSHAIRMTHMNVVGRKKGSERSYSDVFQLGNGEEEALEGTAPVKDTKSEAPEESSQGHDGKDATGDDDTDTLIDNMIIKKHGKSRTPSGQSAKRGGKGTAHTSLPAASTGVKRSRKAPKKSPKS